MATEKVEGRRFGPSCYLVRLGKRHKAWLLTEQQLHQAIKEFQRLAKEVKDGNIQQEKG